MTTTPNPVRGTQDMIGETADRFHAVVNGFKKVRDLYGFGRVEVPVIEPTAVFARSLGETTDVVSKEMYSFPDRSGDEITLRPEFTAGIMRAYLTNGWAHLAPLRLATHGPVFRYERPQSGRYRQFHQLDVEIIGSAEVQADVELLTMADQLLDELKISDGVTLQLNTLGDVDSRNAWRRALADYFQANKTRLGQDSVRRLATNPLRILDSKDPLDEALVAAAPEIDSFLTPQASDRFAELTSSLKAVGVAWTRNPRLVRGLDYYRHAAWEFTTDRLGAQGTVLAGGRYDGLAEALGGRPTPGVGWAAGIERLAALMEPSAPKREVFSVIPMSEAAEDISLEIAVAMRRAGLPTTIDFRGNRKKRFEWSRRREVATIIFVDCEHLEDEALAVLELKSIRNMAHDSERRVAKALSNQFVIPRFDGLDQLGRSVDPGYDLRLARRR